MAQLGLQLGAAAHGLRHVLVIERHGVAPLVLGGVHGQVGVAQQDLDGVAIARVQRHAHAGRHAGVHIANAHRGRYGGRDAVVQRRQVFADVGRHHQHQELIAPPARHHVGAALGVAQALGHGHQQLVARRVPQGVVHVLEVVQIDEEQRHLLPLCLGLGHRPGKALHEVRAIGQAGERVVQGLEVGPLFGAFDGADVRLAHQHGMLPRHRVAALAGR